MDVKTLCLGILSRGDATGYEIRKQVAEGPFSHFFEAGYGSIYPALGKLLESGLVACREQSQDSRPDKKVYSISTNGRLALIDALSAPAAPDRVRSQFLFTTFFAHLLSARQVERLIAERLAWYCESVERMERCSETVCTAERPAGERFTHGLGLTVYKAAAQYLEDHGHELVAEALKLERMDAAD
ncbi:MAG: PadR family transcriptional regulator [Rhodospirillaceae bacterium]|jgi:PadR family transcriptional regulator, regulatory protein AphA|nr:PadR family transcriptional regulator [Rhodospirillaceae bacterium]MBT6118906.1 PadR family transcriptional regulator [Rhodospirillaceae bacterium]